MTRMTPRSPRRPLFWPDRLLDLQDVLADTPVPVYIVGGAVRDAYLHRPIKDIDLATPGDSIKLARAIANHLRGDIFVMDVERGVARVLVDSSEGRLTLDVARFRGEDLRADLADRDFTINAMAVDLKGDLNLLIDPLGGEDDAANKKIRRCSPDSIRDDPIRALRAIRQSAQLAMRIERETLKDIRTFGPQLRDTSPERVRDEFFLLINLPKPAAALRAADSVGLLEVVIPEVQLLKRDSATWSHALATVDTLTDILKAISPARTDHTAASFTLGMIVIQLDRCRHRLWQHINETWPNERPHRALMMLAALLGFMGPALDVTTCAEALRLSNPEKQRLSSILAHTVPDDTADKRVIHRFWHQSGEAGIDVCLLDIAGYLGVKGTYLDQDDWLLFIDRVQILLEAYYEYHDTVVAPPPLLNGTQLIQALHLEPGPIVGKLIDFIREEQAADTVHSEEEALQAARAYLDQNLTGS